MRRCALASALLAASCGWLAEDPLTSKSVAIDAPLDGASVLGRDVVPVEVFVDCPELRVISLYLDGVFATSWASDEGQAEGCSARSGAYCVPMSSATPLEMGTFWPVRLEARAACANGSGEVNSDVHRVYVAPFEGLAMVPGSTRSLFAAAAGGVTAVSAAGIHRVVPGTEISGLVNRSMAARAFAVGDDLYYYAPCDGLACDSASADLFRVDAATLEPRGDRTRLGCAPLAVVGLGEQRVIALGDCDVPRVRWSSVDLATASEEAVDMRFIDGAARRGDEVVMLAWQGDELVIAAAGAAPPLAIRPTGLRGARAALSDDGARVAVLDGAGRVAQVDTATGATLASVALSPRSPEQVLALTYAPGGHRVLVALPDGVWIVDGDVPRRLEPPVDDEGGALVVRAATALDGQRLLVTADSIASVPSTRLVYVTDGATTALRAWVGGDWTMTAPPLLTADGRLHVAFDTQQGPVVVSHGVGAL